MNSGGGHYSVYAADGVIYCSALQDNDTEIDVLTAAGWDYDEDLCMWFFLAERLAEATPVVAAEKAGAA